ncbi:uncharacterized protein LOC131159714 [Malania oleifera]|uniref:uncharacterized protein LOC131159714 n=1 Tax=Malania oleifera TaxID=397392 RepID=UPI0025AE7FEB|nr:uncharacterized protein LOC131159714 [Malania oleifera]
MATQTGGASVGERVNNFKPLKEGNLGRRKPLADISQKQNSKNITIGGKKNASKAKEKVQISGRKPLTDISNSGNPCGRQAPKKHQDKTQNAIAGEEEIHLDEEWHGHNHKECIKVQKKARDLEFDYLLKDVGLDFSMQLATREFPMSRKSKPESPPKHLELEEIDKVLIEDLFSTKSPPRCQSPTSQYLLLEESPFLNWKYCTPRFTLKK